MICSIKIKCYRVLYQTRENAVTAQGFPRDRMVLGKDRKKEKKRGVGSNIR